VEAVDALPLNAAGKVLKYELAARARSRVSGTAESCAVPRSSR
jgi:hypothetical protein